MTEYKEQIDRIDGEVVAQADLLTQIAQELEGKATGGSTEDKQVLLSLINRTITAIEDTETTQIGAYAFRQCANLISAKFPNAISIGVCAFQQCTKLSMVEMPNLQVITNSAFYSAKFAQIDLHVAHQIDTQAFMYNSNLKALILRNSSTICSLKAAGALTGTSIANGTGYVYVPSALVDSYKAATNWSTYANQFRALEDYTVDGTITGALDESKI